MPGVCMNVLITYPTYLSVPWLPQTHTHTHTHSHTHTHMNILASTMGNNSFSHLTNNERHRLDINNIRHKLDTNNIRHRLDTNIKQYIFIQS